MKKPHSLQSKLGLSLGLLLCAIWICAATLTAILTRQTLDEVFDSALQETAQRLLPIAVSEILARDTETVSQRLAVIREPDELLSYVVRDDQGQILLQSYDADPAVFPEWNGNGFHDSPTHRLYNDSALQDSIRITVAEPLAHREGAARNIQLTLGLPLLVILPIAILAIIFVVRGSLEPLRRFRNRLATRSQRDLSLVPTDGLPAEVTPIADTMNALLTKLSAAFEAERSFAANAAHELRTPIAGAIAQVQRLRSETQEPEARARASDIEATLKRLTRLSERLLQLARAEGGALRLDQTTDLRPIATLLTDDLRRTVGHERIALTLPASPLMSDLDPDVFAIIYRNLVENALRHGEDGTPVVVSLDDKGVLTVSNDGPVVPEAVLQNLTRRFERWVSHGDGSGLGLAIVNAIAQRTGSQLELKSPRVGQQTGFQATFALPVAGPSDVVLRATAFIGGPSLQRRTTR